MGSHSDEFATFEDDCVEFIFLLVVSGLVLIMPVGCWEVLLPRMITSQTCTEP